MTNCTYSLWLNRAKLHTLHPNSITLFFTISANSLLLPSSSLILPSFPSPLRLPRSRLLARDVLEVRITLVMFLWLATTSTTTMTIMAYASQLSRYLLIVGDLQYLTAATVWCIFVKRSSEEGARWIEGFERVNIYLELRSVVRGWWSGGQIDERCRVYRTRKWPAYLRMRQ